MTGPPPSYAKDSPPLQRRLGRSIKGAKAKYFG